MNAKDGGTAMGLERLSALFALWGMPKSNGSGNAEAQIKRFEGFASDLQKTCSEAYSRRIQALFAANERLTQSFQEVMRCRQPQDLLVAEANIVATMLEGASAQTRAWAEFAQKVEACCAAMLREAATEAGKRGHEPAAATPLAESVGQAIKQVGKQRAGA